MMKLSAVAMPRTEKQEWERAPSEEKDRGDFYSQVA
jgi:hypothetical protein